MAQFKKYDVIMKILDIVEKDTITGEQNQQTIKPVIERIEGDFIIGENIKKEIGDRFENISQSVIATRGSIAKGIIKIREVEGDELAEAIQKLEKAIAEAQPIEMPDKDKHEALQLLEEITKQASSPNKVKVVLKTLGKNLWESVKNVESISKTAALVWPIISRLWI